MKFSDIIDQAKTLLQRQGRLTYRSLKREFDLDDEALEDLKFELITGQELAVDKDGAVLVWVGDGAATPKPTSPAGQSLPPVSYTPPHLAERIRAEQAALEARGTSEGERKIITALFADLKGSTALIEGLDPEEARAIIDPALQLMMDAVHQYDGYVAQALGDGIFALFGAPLAHEDHPQRALYAALRMQEEMRLYADTLRTKGYPPLLMRVGLNTGEVVLRSIRKDDLRADYVPVGHSTNLAARMEQLAAPGSILVTAYTHRLTDGYFVFKDLGQTQIKGVEDLVNVYEVLGSAPLRTRLQVTATRRGLTRFVGRQGELEQMQQALAQAKARHGQIVGVMGEPGLGKSRLFYEFTLLSQSGCLVLAAYSVSHGKASPYLPVIELLKTYFQIQPQDDERTRRERVIEKVLGLDRSLEDTLPYLYALFGIKEQPSPLQQMDAQIRRQRTFDALKKLFSRESLNQPLILIFEDLHWIDTETQGFLDVLSENMANARILLLVNYRPEYRYEWGQKIYSTQLRLAPFGIAEAEEFLEALVGTTVGTPDRAPLQDFKQLILAKTEGTPFFMEEVVQALAEEGVLVGDRGSYRLTHHAPTLHIPTTVQSVLAARIDRLAPGEKTLLQQLAVIGREFPVSLIRQVINQPENELSRPLASLQRKEFLYEQPAFPEVEYIFKHVLTQEVAYGTVLHEQRKALHERTGQALEALYPTTLDDHYSELAHHYTRSGNTEKAVEYLHLAGQQAVQRSANAEAIVHLTTALELLKTLPDTPEHAQQELLVQVALGPALIFMKGFTAPEVEQTYARAYALCRRCERPDQLLEVLWGLHAFYLVRGEVHRARELAEQQLHLAQRIANPIALINAHVELGISLTYLGELTAAHEHFEQAWRLYHLREYDLNAMPGEEDPGAWLLTRIAFSLRALGYPDQAQGRLQESLALAERRARPFGLILALISAGFFHADHWEWQRVRELTQEVIRLSTEQGFSYSLAYGTAMQGWALAEQGLVKEGITQMQQGLVAFRTTGAELARLEHFPWLAAAYARAGQIEEGLTVLTEALAVVDRTGARVGEAELYRLAGELLLRAGEQASGRTGEKEGIAHSATLPFSHSAPEDYFHKAIEISRKQQAKSLELRAVMSLAQLWQKQGKKAEARQTLAEIYDWFTEGFDTKDLQEAKVLLEELT